MPQVDRRVAERDRAPSPTRSPTARYADEFPIDAFQTGSGTSTNMNMNEVLAGLASARLGEAGAVHPNDQVNASQSSNDVFPSAVHLAAAQAIADELIPAAEKLAQALRKKQREFAHVVKSGRTHLMDATPVTLGQEFGGYATQVDDGDRAPARRAAAAVRAPARRHRGRHRASTRRRGSPAR